MTSEQRLTNRIDFDEGVTIRSPERMEGKTVDIGAGGIGLLVPREIPAGAMVEMEILSGHAITYGTVRWSRPDGDQFRLGIQFRQEDWSIIELVLTLRSQEG